MGRKVAPNSDKCISASITIQKMEFQAPVRMGKWLILLRTASSRYFFRP